MRKTILFLTLYLTISCTLKAQSKLPTLDIKDVVFHIPSFLPGIMKDTTASIRNDTLVYNLKGQMFDTNPLILIPNRSFTSLATPWETTMELANAYLRKNEKKIIDLYSEESKSRVTSLLSSGKATNFFNGVSKAARSNFRILGGIEYKDGFMVFSKDDTFGVHQNYVIKESNRYKLSALDDNTSTAWNIAIFLRFAPRQIIPLQNIVVPDSIRLTDTFKLSIALPDSTNNWVAVFGSSPRENIRTLVQDNGINDLSPVKNHVTFALKARTFVNRGKHTFYIASFNYPIYKTSQSFFLAEGKYSISIY